MDIVERGCAYIIGLVTGVWLMAGAVGLIAFQRQAESVMTTTVNDVVEFSGVGKQTKRLEIPAGNYELTDDDTTIIWRRIEGDCDDVPPHNPNDFSNMIITFGGPVQFSSEGCIIEIDFGEEGREWSAKIERLP